jgi:hypothetical protein
MDILEATILVPAGPRALSRQSSVALQSGIQTPSRPTQREAINASAQSALGVSVELEHHPVFSHFQPFAEWLLRTTAPTFLGPKSVRNLSQSCIYVRLRAFEKWATRPLTKIISSGSTCSSRWSRHTIPIRWLNSGRALGAGSLERRSLLISTGLVCAVVW